MTLLDTPTTADRLRADDWYLGATRWTQLTFVEDDPAHFDLDAWVDVMRRTRSNAVCISAGGYMAFYPTAIEHHYTSSFLGDTDPFGAVVDAARGLGMHVMARVDPHAIHADAAAAHPEWLARDEHGEAIEHPAFPGIFLTCPFSSYNREFLTDVARELVTDYDIDAVFANRWQGTGMSYSESARRGFRDATGLELPVGAFREDDPSWQAYPQWRRQQLTELVGLWDDAVREIRPHARFLPNLGSFAAHELERDLVQRHYPLFFVDRQARSGDEAPWSAGRNGKRSRATFRDRPVGLITSVGPESGHRWKDSVNAGAETAMWIVDGFAHGAFPWFTKFNAVISDDRWIEPVADAFGLHARLEPALADLTPTAEVALLEPVIDPERGVDARAHGNRDGSYQALVEARLPFELVSDRNLTIDELRRFRVVVLPDVARMSDAHLEALRQFAAEGGSLVATHRTSLEHEDGTPREQFGLADVLGVDLVAAERGPVRNNYIELSDPSPLHDAYPTARRIIGGTRLMGVSAREGVAAPFRFIPDFPDLPMEEVYPREQARDAAVTTWERPDGGRSVYIAFDLAALYWEALLEDHGRLLADAVRWALGSEPEVAIEGPGLLDVALRRGPDALAVSIVNLTNPMAMRGQLRETFPVGPLTVEIALPEGFGAAEAELLVSGASAPVSATGDRIRVTVPSINLLEVVHVTRQGATR